MQMALQLSRYRMKKKPILVRIWYTITRINVIWKIRKFFKWLKKSVEYAWFLRKDEDWDYQFIFELLKYKLQRTRKCIIKNDFIEASKRVEKQIKYAEYLIDLYQSGEYPKSEARYSEHKKKWGKRKSSFTPIEGQPKLLAYTPNWENCKTPEDTELAMKELQEAYRYEQQLEDETLERLFTHLNRYIRRWWD